MRVLHASTHALAPNLNPSLLLPTLSLAPCLLFAVGARGAEPPDRPGLSCTVSSHSIGEGQRIEIVFSNATGEAVSLPPGPHLVLYRDSAANDPMETTARVDRIQRTPLQVPANGSATGLYGMDGRQADELLCNGTAPAAAALYFYQFSPRPTFRCLLREFRLASLPMKSHCTRADLVVPATRPK